MYLTVGWEKAYSYIKETVEAKSPLMIITIFISILKKALNAASLQCYFTSFFFFSNMPSPTVLAESSFATVIATTCP